MTNMIFRFIIFNFSFLLFVLLHYTCESHITEADARDAISMSATVIWTGLRNVDAIQGKWWSISVQTTLLEPTEPGFTGELGEEG